MGILLAFISLILFVIIFFCYFLFSLFFETSKRKWFNLISNRLYNKAKLIDIFANYLFPELWTFLFSIKNKDYKFGILGETLSSVLGKKKIDNSLNIFGLLIYYILYVIDFDSWKYGGHCVRWQMSEKEIKKFKE